jgi:hypothetical protein
MLRRPRASFLSLWATVGDSKRLFMVSLELSEIQNQEVASARVAKSGGSSLRRTYEIRDVPTPPDFFA